MNAGVILAISCLFFSGLNDFIFKKFSSIKSQSVGTYVSAAGLVWFLLQMILYTATGDTGGFTAGALLYSVIPGLLVLSSNIMLIESMTVLDASMGSTVYRLNTVPAVILSIIFLNEKLSLMGILGITSSVIAVLFLLERKEKAESKKYILFLLLCISASLLRALFAFSAKYLIVSGIEQKVINTVSALSWFSGGAVYALLREKKISLRAVNLKYSFLSGFFIFIVAVLLFNAIERGNLSIIIPISNMGFLVTYLLAILAGIEKLTAKKVTALLLAAAAIVFLSAA